MWTVAYQAPLSMEFSRQEYWFRDSSRPGDQTCISWAFFIGRQILHTSETSLWKASPTERQWEGVSIWTPEVSLPSSPLLYPSCLPPKEKQTSVSPTGPLENWHFFFFKFLFYIGVQLINNMLVSGVFQSDSVIHIHVPIILFKFFPQLSC